jgi:SAM-dependent methyltransferase
MRDDHQNLVLVETGQAAVDAANAEFYSAFPYPWPPMAFPRLEDPRFEAVMLNQSFGDFTHRTVPADGRIWVAGCGTNQAVYTALRFPEAAVLGSDLSAASLELASRNAKTLGLDHLTLRQESLNQVTYAGEFDHIICTGVIHHNADPAHALRALSLSLRPGGVLAENLVVETLHAEGELVPLVVCGLDRFGGVGSVGDDVRRWRRFGRRCVRLGDLRGIAWVADSQPPIDENGNAGGAAQQDDQNDCRNGYG